MTDSYTWKPLVWILPSERKCRLSMFVDDCSDSWSGLREPDSVPITAEAFCCEGEVLYCWEVGDWEI